MTAGSLRHPRNWALATRAACALAAASLLLAWAPGWTLARMRASRMRDTEDDEADVDRIASAVWTIAGRSIGSGCLPRAVAIAALSRREGVATTLVIGVRRDGRDLAAHAWVEHRGVPVPRQDVGGYARLWESR